MRLKDVATSAVITLNPADSVDKATALMEEHGIHHLPVVDDTDTPIGMVSDRDLLSAAGWLSGRDRIDPHDGTVIGPRVVREIMSTPVRTLDPLDPVEAGGKVMLNETIGAVALVSDGCMEGLVTESDFMKCFTDDRPLGMSSEWRFQKVADHMSVHVFALLPKDATVAAARLMREKRIRHLPITQDERLVGIVSDRDVRKAVFRELVESQQDDGSGGQQARRINLRDIMSRRIETVSLSTTLADAADRMMSATVSALPIVEQQNLMGIVTETDLLKAFVAAFRS